KAISHVHKRYLKLLPFISKQPCIVLSPTDFIDQESSGSVDSSRRTGNLAKDPAGAQTNGRRAHQAQRGVKRYTDERRAQTAGSRLADRLQNVGKDREGYPADDSENRPVGKLRS